MSLKYEPSSEPLHISAYLPNSVEEIRMPLDLAVEVGRDEFDRGGSGLCEERRAPHHFPA